MTAVDITRDAPRAQLPPIDPNVKIPPAVAAAAARAEGYYTKQPVEPAQPTGEAPVVAGDPAPPAPPPAAVQPAAQPAPPAPAPAVTTQVTPEQPAPPAPPDEGSWEHKFKSQQGRVTAQNQTIRQQQQQLSDMGGELVELHRQVEQLARAAAPAAPTQRLVTDDERTAFGEEFVSVAARAAQEVLSPEMAALRGEVADLRQQNLNTAIRGVYSALNDAVPNWRIINPHPAFVHWLGLRDPISGGIRKVLLDSAFRAADAARVVAIFQGFVAEDAASRPADQPQPTAPIVQARTPAVSLETLAAPGRARSSPAVLPAGGKPVYTRQDIDKFYTDCRRQIYAGRDAERNAIEHDIVNVAPREGRIR